MRDLPASDADCKTASLGQVFVSAHGSETGGNRRAEIRELQGRLRAAKKRLAYHTRAGHGASRTRMAAGEAISLAKADIGQLTHFIENSMNTNTESNHENAALPNAAPGYAPYHPDPEINAEVEAEAVGAEVADLAAGYPPSWWLCPECGASHNRGWFGVAGSHRCLRCGYAGGGGVMAHTRSELLRHIDEAHRSAGKERGS